MFVMCTILHSTSKRPIEIEPNAAAQARQTAGARDERTLFAVACSRLLGWLLLEVDGQGRRPF